MEICEISHKIASATITGSNVASSTITASNLSGVWWEELGRTTLVSNSDTISVTGLTARKYLRLQFHTLNSGSTTVVFRFNNDSSANYTSRYLANGSFGTATSQTFVGEFASSSAISGFVDIINTASTVKTGKATGLYNGTASNTAPSAVELWFSWVNTSAQINRIDIVNMSTGDFVAGSQLVVLGHD